MIIRPPRRLARRLAVSHHHPVHRPASPSAALAAALRPLAAAAAFALACVGEGGEGGEPPADDDLICARYLACAAAGDLKALEARLGAAGACWSDVLAEQRACVDECVAGLAERAACEPPSAGNDAVLELGQAIFDPLDPFAPPTWGRLAAGDRMPIVRGGQGLLMLGLGLRGANFEIAADPFDFADPKMPQIDLWMDVDGYNVGYAGHFARVYNYPIPFKARDDDPSALEFLYVAILVPDAITDPAVLDGRPGHIWVELHPYGEASIIRELDVIVAAEDL